MNDTNSVILLGRIASVPAINDKYAFFNISHYQEDVKATIGIIVQVRSLIELSVKPYIIQANIGKRAVFHGRVIFGASSTYILAHKIDFIDRFVSLEQEQNQIDFSED